MFDGDPILWNWVENCGLLSKQFDGPKTSKCGPNFGQYLQKETTYRRMAFQTAVSVSPAHANIIRRTLVYKRRKIWPEFRPTQRARVVCVTFRSSYVVVMVPGRVQRNSTDLSRCTWASTRITWRAAIRLSCATLFSCSIFSRRCVGWGWRWRHDASYSSAGRGLWTDSRQAHDGVRQAGGGVQVRRGEREVRLIDWLIDWWFIFKRRWLIWSLISL